MNLFIVKRYFINYLHLITFVIDWKKTENRSTLNFHTFAITMYAPHLLSLDDLELVKNYQQTNNIECVGILYQRYGHLIFGVCMKYLRNDADAQDTSIQIFEKLLVSLKKSEVNQFKHGYILCVKTIA